MAASFRVSVLLGAAIVALIAINDHVLSSSAGVTKVPQGPR
jgi:hypothetical protein